MTRVLSHFCTVNTLKIGLIVFRVNQLERQDTVLSGYKLPIFIGAIESTYFVDPSKSTALLEIWRARGQNPNSLQMFFDEASSMTRSGITNETSLSESPPIRHLW
jgi:hypothetical protein